MGLLNCPKSLTVSYVGGISAIRGIREVVRAMEHVQSGIELSIAGDFSNKSLADEVRGYPGWERVNELGYLNRTNVRDLLAVSLAGIVTFLPAPNHTDAQPNKMFEYMSSGVPVIASNFPLWREIIEGNNCGICVDPLNPKAIATAIDTLLRPRRHARWVRMGEKLLEKFNWGSARKIIEFV